MFSGHALHVVSFPWTPTVLSHRIRELLELSTRRNVRTHCFLYTKRKTIVVVFFAEHPCQNEIMIMTRKQVNATPVHPFCRFLSNKGGKRKKRWVFLLSCETLEVASSSTSWRAALLQRDAIFSPLALFPFPGRELTVHRPHRDNRPCWRVVRLRSAVQCGLDALTANHRSLRCLGRRNIEHKWINLWWIYIELNVR